MLKGTDAQHAGAIAFLKRVFGSRSTAGRVATPQDLSVTKQHRNDRWDRCTASAGDWQIITTTSHRSANQRYFMHNSATVHRMRMQSSALDSSRSQLCNDTSTGVVRHQITEWRRLQKVVSYDVLHHMFLTKPNVEYHLSIIHVIDYVLANTKNCERKVFKCNTFCLIAFSKEALIDQREESASAIAVSTTVRNGAAHAKLQAGYQKISLTLLLC